jgi:hypothetical protein
MTTGVAPAAFCAASAAGVPPGRDEVHSQPNELGCELWEPVGTALGGPILDDEVLALDVTKLPQALLEGLEIRGVHDRGRRLQYPDAVDPPGVLRPGAW